MQQVSPAATSLFTKALPFFGPYASIETVLFCRLVSTACADAVHTCTFWEKYVLIAAQGSAEGETVYKLAKLLLKVRGNKDGQGNQLMARAAEQQQSSAFFDIGMLALNQYKMAKRKTLSQTIAFLAIHFNLSKAAELEHTEAQYNYGKFLIENAQHLHGIYYISQAAHKAHTAAQALLGKSFLQDPPRENEGIYFLKLAARSGDAQAFTALARRVGWRGSPALDNSFEDIQFRVGMFLAERCARKKCFAHDEVSAKALLEKKFPFFALFSEVLLGFLIYTKTLSGGNSKEEAMLLSLLEMRIKMAGVLVLFYCANGNANMAIHYFHKLACGFDQEVQSSLQRKFLDCCACISIIALISVRYEEFAGILKDEFCKLLQSCGDETEIGEIMATSVFASHWYADEVRDANLDWAKKILKKNFVEPSQESAVSFLLTLKRIKNVWRSPIEENELNELLLELQSVSSPLKRSLINMEV